MELRKHKPNWVPSKRQHHYFKVWYFCKKCLFILQEEKYKVLCNVGTRIKRRQKKNYKVKTTVETKVDYYQHIKSDRWTLFSQLVRDMYSKCARCQSRIKLCVHHASYNNVGREKLTDVRVLCEKCHKLFHDTYKLQKDMTEQTDYFINSYKD